MDLTLNQVGWLAGMFDGEGSVNIGRKNRVGGSISWMPRLSVSNKRHETLELIRDWSGSGVVRRMPERIPGQVNPVFRWMVDSAAAESFLRMILPCLVTKRDQAILVLRACDLRRSAPKNRRGTYRGSKGAITDETHSEIARMAAAVKLLNHTGFQPYFGLEPRPDDWCGMLGWAAGIMDGEGSISLRRRAIKNDSTDCVAWVPRLRVGMTCRRSVEFMRSLFGIGGIQVRSYQHGACEKKFHTWSVEGRGAGEVLGKIVSMMVTRLDQAKLALEALRVAKESPRVPRGAGRGSGAPAMSPETHERLAAIKAEIERINAC